MAVFIAIKKLGSLRPVDQMGIDAIAKLKEGEQVTVECKRARNGKQHRLYWALMNLIYGQQSRYATLEQMSNAIKCAVGYCDEIETKGGKVLVIPKSIAFHAMPQDQFAEFFDRVLELVTTKILPNVSDADLRAELELMVS
jgi:hypothetical protein